MSELWVIEEDIATMSDSHAEKEQHEHSHADTHTHNGPIHGRDDDHSHNHEHGHRHGPLGWLLVAVPFLHGHSHGEAKVDRVLETSDRGISSLKASLAVPFVTALFQFVFSF